jgi:hypothetical protein
MAFVPINLIDSQFQNSLLFEYLPLFDAIFYEGHPEGHIQRYKALREDQECVLIALSIIRKEEDFLWAACEDLFERTVRAADVLSTNKHEHCALITHVCRVCLDAPVISRLPDRMCV